MMQSLTGWLLDLYESPGEGLVVWLIGEDGARYRLRQNFPVTFYAAGPSKQLRALWRYLRHQPVPVHLARDERRDLFQPDPIPVLAVQVQQPADQPRLFRQVSRTFPNLTYYDADLPISLRHAAVYHTFPLARCQMDIDRAEPDDDEAGQIRRIETFDTPWELDPVVPPLRILSVQPDEDPTHAAPQGLLVRTGPHDQPQRLPMQTERSLLVGLGALLRRFDPDLILTAWGDTWLLPHLLELQEQTGIRIPLNRDANRQAVTRPERVYFAYGQVIYRGQQVRLFGRGHLDVHNAVLFGDYGLDGVLEMSRVTSLPLQSAARLSPGTGISSMQIITALRLGILVPWHKQQAEYPKSAMDLIQVDRGGMVYQPIIGLHKDVAEIDFISMYPSIMARFNVSPETVGPDVPNAQNVPGLNLMIDPDTPGLVPQTLDPLLNKRLALKGALAEMPRWDPRRKDYKARASAHKWLLVTCFGYLGYKNARFGRIEAHEAVTAYGREALLLAKEAAEDLGFTVLHMYVDGLWVRRDGASQVSDFQPLLEKIIDRTGLPIALDGIYRWVAFLPSRTDERVPVANRYFGVFQDGSQKVRGIEIRRDDTPNFIAEIQQTMLERMAELPSADDLPSLLPEFVDYLQRWMSALQAGRVPLEKLLVSQKLSKELDEYRVPSPPARAARQLQAIGREFRPGQRVRFIFTRGKPGVYAWDLPEPLHPGAVDVARYRRLTLRAAYTLLQPLGLDENTLENWITRNAGYLAPPGVLPPRWARKSPLWSYPLVPGNVPGSWVSMFRVPERTEKSPILLPGKLNYAIVRE